MNKLIHGNCFEELKKIEDKSVDLILTDPPYNLGEYSTGNMNFSWRKSINNDIADWDRGFDPEMVKDDFIRILKPTGNIFVFCSYNLIGRWHQLFDSVFDTFQFFVWHKTNPVPKFRKAGFLNSCEIILCMWNKNHIWNFGKQNEMHNFFESSICMGEERLKNPSHPTQKPIKLLQHIIKIASNEGSLVLDPFMGVGSTGCASLALNRRFTGIEIDENYYNAAKNRINAQENLDNNTLFPHSVFVEALKVDGD